MSWSYQSRRIWSCVTEDDDDVMLDGIVEVLRELDFSPKLLNPWNPESVLKSLNPESWERERGLRYIYILHQGLVFAIMLLDLWSWVCSTRLVSGGESISTCGFGSSNTYYDMILLTVEFFGKWRRALLLPFEVWCSIVFVFCTILFVLWHAHISSRLSLAFVMVL